MKAIIPTGGRGTRMQPLTFSFNKHFIPVANKPLIFYPIETVAAVGVKEVGVTYNPGSLELVKSFLGDGSRWGLKLTYILQEKPIGLANIVQVCEEYLSGSPFMFHLGDNIFSAGLKEIVNHFLTKKPNGLLTMIHHKENRRMGVPYFDRHGHLKKYVEKPKNPPHDFAVPGVYFADKTFFKAFKGNDKVKPSARGEYEIPGPFQWLVNHGYRVDVVEYKGKWLDPGKFDDWIEANQYLLDRNTKRTLGSKISKNSLIENRVSLGKHCKITNSKIRGPAAIGDGVTIVNSYVGPFTSVGNGSRIENSHVENCVIMEGVRIVNIKQPIETSLIGTNATITNSVGPTQSLKFFIGEKSQISI